MTPDPIVRRDFPRVPDGYDPAAVDAHLEALAAALSDDPAPARWPTGAADRDLLATGRLILGQISALRVELKNVSASLRDQSLAISDTLEELLELDDLPGPPASPPRSEEAPAPETAPAPAVPRRPAAAEATPTDEPGEATLADARIVALDMALGGSGRDEIGRELVRRFDLADPDGLVDDVLAALG